MSFSRVAAALVLLAAGGAGAQTSGSRSDQIVCALSGSCDPGTPAADRQIPIGQEKSFSLVRPTASAPAAQAAPAPARAAGRHYAAASRRASAARAAPAAGRIDMLVSFPNGSAELTPGSRQEAQAFATALGSPSLAGMHFVVAGHTDAVGGQAYNLDLSRRRAQTVVDYLVSQGVDRSRLEAKGLGSQDPRPGTSPRDPSNRRVEVVKAA